MFSLHDIQRLAREKWGAGNGSISIQMQGVNQIFVHDQTGRSVTLSLTRADMQKSEAEFVRDVIAPQLEFLRDTIKRID